MWKETFESGRDLDEDSIVANENVAPQDEYLQNAENGLNESGSSSVFESASNSINSYVDTINVPSDNSTDSDYEPEETVVIPPRMNRRSLRSDVRSNALNLI